MTALPAVHETFGVLIARARTERTRERANHVRYGRQAE
jgi:hypothetical protein